MFRAVRVKDGDTLVMDRQFSEQPNLWILGETYRLAGIDAPEKYTAAGPASTAALAGFIAGAALTGRVLGKDSFGRYILSLDADGVLVNQWMIDNGYAVVRFW